MRGVLDYSGSSAWTAPVLEVYMQRIRLIVAPLTFSFIFGALAGCEKSTAPQGSSKSNVTFRAARVGIVNKSVNPKSIIVVHRTDTLVIEKVSLTLQDIDMERTTQSVECKDGVNSGNADCSDWVDGPIRVNLNLTDATKGHTLSIPLQKGTYDVISFDISVPDGGDPAEQAYIAANPDMANASVLVIGTFNRQPFTFKTDVRGDREVVLNPPLVVSEDKEVSFHFAVEFDAAMWFRRADLTLIDPRTTNDADIEKIKQNIRDRIESESIP
jgi:hypothetical protein